MVRSLREIMARTVATSEDDDGAVFSPGVPGKEIEAGLAVTLRHRCTVQKPVEHFRGRFRRARLQDKNSRRETGIVVKVCILYRRDIFQRNLR